MFFFSFSFSSYFANISTIAPHNSMKGPKKKGPNDSTGERVTGQGDDRGRARDMDVSLAPNTFFFLLY